MEKNTIGINHKTLFENYGKSFSKKILIAITVIFVTTLFTPVDSHALWPFSLFKKKPVIATVGDRKITVEAFSNSIDKLHTSKHVGKAMLGGKTSGFQKQRYEKHLSEMIDDELILYHSTELGLDKEFEYTNGVDVFILNLALTELREDEVTKKVKVSDAEILELYNQRLKEEKKEKVIKEGEVPVALVDKVLDEGSKKFGGKHGENVAGDGTVPGGLADKVGAEDIKTLRIELYNTNLAKRQKDFFVEVVDDAKVKKFPDVIKSVSKTMENPLKVIVAKVNGLPINALELLRRMDRKNTDLDDSKAKALELLILQKALDSAALSHGYQKKTELKEKVEIFKRNSLIEKFKRDIILGSVKIEDKDLTEYFDNNKAEFKAPDLAKFSVIVVRSKEAAQEVVAELKDGADFTELAKVKSIDPSKENGGNVSPVPVNMLPADLREKLKTVKKDEILGPYPKQYGFSVFKFESLREGEFASFKQVKRQIQGKVGKVIFDKMLANYMKKLRESVSVDINKEILEGLS
ncbi:MAG: peptidyl-prolyl cis-trans isomerase [Deltaproteobacteria bacterium]|nr:peptidyl-prolyl cis-trans isomerase [Deltaproteobacteria bacterium]